MKTFFQSLHRGPPFRRRWLAHGVLVAKHTNSLDCLCDRFGLQPLHWNKVLAVIRIVRKPAVVVGFRNFKERLFAGSSGHGKIADGLDRAFDRADTDKA